MRKFYFQWKAIAASLMLCSASALIAQDYNNAHRFATDYERSAHTSVHQLASGKIIEGGTVRSLKVNAEKVVELGYVDPGNGTLSPHPLTYAYPGLSHTAADLTESLGDKGYVVCAANMSPGSFRTFNMVNIFKTDPSSGNVMWSILYKSPSGHQYASAITSDNEKSYFVVGHTDFGGQILMYLIKIKDDGTPLWERYYLTGIKEHDLRGVDVAYDGSSVVVTGNLSNNLIFPNQSAVVVAKINPLSGGIIDSRILPVLGDSKNLKVRDLEIINGNYVIVGEVNPPAISPIFIPQRGFMVRYNQLLNVTATRIYGDGNNYNVAVTGVVPGNSFIFGDMYMSFDLRTTSNIFPGIMQTNSVGSLISSELFKVPGYLGTNGLIGVNNLRSYLIKGSYNSSSVAGAPALSLIGQSVPLAGNDKTCSFLYELKNEEVKYKSDKLELGVKKDETANKIELEVEKIDGKTYDCHGNTIGSFRLARPALADAEDIATDFDIFPNPSNGNISIQFNNGDVAAYEVGEVYNLMGEAVSTFYINNTTTKVDLSGKTPGIYMIRLKSSDGSVSDTKRIVVE